MKLSKFKKDQLSVATLRGIKGGLKQMEMELEEGSTQSNRHSTSCTGSDHDGSRHDSD
ncbi:MULTISPECIES: hypothetical protein [unclassified Chryseobacterium]|uniref:hypothetical protein n=1 Tax=unclassified Chryseobacterium TaxID=2593645 RepID=UPI0013FE3492|nr:MULTISPECIES: hypothetical protein [unclassified Chryseobacterium]WNI34779.1 hypothetical protein RHP76_12395 [Chryseobacterium sp. SG20098]WNI34781.1 hypothetical protein RHP76_12405 [Chryseobacterium sp. SG20098]